MRFPSACINHNWLFGEGEQLSKFDSTKGTLLWQAKAAEPSLINLALDTARSAFYAWSQLSYQTRLDYCLGFAEKVEQNRNQLKLIISQETGKPLWEADTEVTAVINKVKLSDLSYQARTADILISDTEIKMITRHKPRGVVAVLGPFNFPAHLPNGHIIPALLAGNTIVLKPSEKAPLTSHFILELWLQSGLPKGVINLLQGGKDTAQVLIESPKLDAVFFTGSSKTGIAMQQACLNQPHKLVALELGGNNPLIIGKVKDLKAASYLTIQSAFLSAGQRCTCARRLLVEKSPQGDAFLTQLIKDIRNIQVGHYDQQPCVFYGALVDLDAAQNILNSQKSLVKQGGKLLVEGQLIEPKTALLSPSLIDVSNISELPDKEYFGPLLQVIRYDKFEAAIEIANHTQYGLSAGILSDLDTQYLQFYQQSRAGIVNWNQALTGASGQAPFGGIGLSGNARPSAFYAADYCAYPVASMESKQLKMPEKITSGLKF
ncbi:succinylglutamate-semialdehyde dehydrogenase [Catenovulum maritimum]|uniref:Succinylglutamate-semialdehyde dehydrogenase n=1 Tax=Catenovulum maritimum TaxID=1513271 RepID=A0A0J8JMB3_9ALTE|nr:succinylglutamate-semialdehyde dehydrogenase [Catenovulum maritimum]KMT65736.1 succinylglutamate-semialdehyde dehydrogenase [Catenovulum maritimum]